MLRFGFNLTLLKKEINEIIETTRDWKHPITTTYDKFWSLFKKDRHRFDEVYDKFKFLRDHEFMSSQMKARFWLMFSEIENVNFEDTWMSALQPEFEKTYFQQVHI